MREASVSPGEAGGRLDKYLLKYMNEAPHGFIYKMLRKKRIKLNGARAEGSEILRAGDVLTFYLSDETVSAFTSVKNVNAAAGGLDVIFEDADILLVNKPAGMLIHSDKPGHGDSLAERLPLYLSQQGALAPTFTPAPSNRLDRNTSGIVLCGKHPAAVRALNAMLAGDTAEKIYLAAAAGSIREPRRITGYIYKDAGSNESVVEGAPFPGSKKIITEYAPIGWGAGVSLLCVKLITGRAHQIRAQLKALGSPVLGDPKYGDIYANRRFKLKFQLLHAVCFIFPGSNKGLLEKYNNQTIWAPAPAYFSAFIKKEIGEWQLHESDNISRGLRDQIISPDAGQAQSAVKHSGESDN